VLASAIAALAAAAAADAVPQKETPVTESATKGNVRADLSYVKVVESAGFTTYRDLRLTISRDGQVVESRQPPRWGSFNLLWPGSSWKNSKSVHVADLDGDDEPEVTVDLYTGGAHCCRMLYAYRWNGTAYAAQQMQTGSSLYSQRDLDADGRPEWITADPRFEYLFTSFAGSAVPLRIYDYRDGNFVAVTGKFPSLVRKDATRWWRIYQRRPSSNYSDDNRGFLAAWAADMCLLGEGARVWPTLAAANRQGKLGGQGSPTGLAYIGKLRQKLRAFGYLR
jgi:hypothetical protein